MYIATAQIIKSIERLAVVHPFHGITFLACKEARLPVGSKVELRMDALTKKHMDKHHRLAPSSTYYFQPFSPSRSWVKHDYPSSGLQAINTQTFREAFIHPPIVPLWGWSEIYIDELHSRLRKKRKIPAFDLSVWLYRSVNFEQPISPVELIQQFMDHYHITDEERTRLFDRDVPERIEFASDAGVTSWASLRSGLQPPPDALPESGGTLAYLELRGTGPAPLLAMEPAEHLTLITGDNGLGKTFLLECSWWALTGEWADKPALPRADAEKGKELIRFSIRSQVNATGPFEIRFDWETLTWPRPNRRPTIAGLIVYARVDGSFSVWDPIKFLGSKHRDRGGATFSATEIWDGRQGEIEGMIRDWGRWQRELDSSAFQTFCEILKDLSPPDLGPLTVGELTRIPNDPRDIPTIRHPYGETPIVFASAGVKRILALAYLMVWAWREHQVSSDLAKRKPETRMVVLIDEMEAHLHPRWQREVLPAVASVLPKLADDLEVQMIVATHSPLVLASAETIFDDESDSLFHLDLDGDDVSLAAMPFVRHGDVSRWLTSDVIQLKHARSRQAETAIEKAKSLQNPGTQVDREDVRKVTEALRRYLADDDAFWPRWIGFAEKFEVKV